MSHHVADRVVAETIAVEIIAIIGIIAMMIATIKETIEITIAIIEITIDMIRIIIQTIRRRDLPHVMVDPTADVDGPMGTADVDVADKVMIGRLEDKIKENRRAKFPILNNQSDFNFTLLNRIIPVFAWIALLAFVAQP